MNQLLTTGIILRRTDYGEADRIITILTPDHGKLHLLAKGVRRIKSKLAGGIELFSVSHLTYLAGRKELGTLVSTRLIKHYGHIVNDIDRTMLGYDLIKQLDKATEDEPEPEYFELLQAAFAALDDTAIDTELVKVWFGAQLLRQSGHTPNLQTDTAGAKLSADTRYDFSLDDMGFRPMPEGAYGADQIKFLRLVLGGNTPQTLAKITAVHDLTAATARLVALMREQYIR